MTRTARLQCLCATTVISSRTVVSLTYIFLLALNYYVSCKRIISLDSCLEMRNYLESPEDKEAQRACAANFLHTNPAGLQSGYARLRLFNPYPRPNFPFVRVNIPICNACELSAPFDPSSAVRTWCMVCRLSHDAYHVQVRDVPDRPLL